MKKKIALSWKVESYGLYSNTPFDKLFSDIGHNNGNLAYVYAVANQLDADITVESRDTPAEKLNQYDAVVFPAANLFGQHANLQRFLEIFEKIEVPIIVIGLGAQSKSFEHDAAPPEPTVDWVRIVNSRRFGSTSNIYTRGPYTSRQLARFGIDDSIVGGCPSHFINPDPNLGKAIETDWRRINVPRAISVCAGHQSWSLVKPIEQQLIAMMMDPVAIGQYVVQSMSEMVKISRGMVDDLAPDVLERIRQYTVPHYDIGQFKTWCQTYARSFYDVPAWMDSLRRYDLTIGARFHGVQLAIQGEKMGCVIAHDARTEEMCIQTGVPYLNVSALEGEPLTRSRLKTLITFDGTAYDVQRKERAQNYVTFLESNGLKPRDFLKNLAQS